MGKVSGIYWTDETTPLILDTWSSYIKYIAIVKPPSNPNEGIGKVNVFMTREGLGKAQIT